MDASARRRDERRRLPPLLGTIGVVALLAAVVAGYAQRALFDSDQFAARAAATLENEAVQEELAGAVTDGVVLNADRDLVALRPVIQGVAQQVVASGPFRGLFRASVADVHRSVFDRNANTVTLTIANLGVVLEAALARLAPNADVRLDVEVLDSDPPDAVLELVQAAENVRVLAIVLALVALVALAGALALSGDRRESLRRGGIGVAIGASLLIVAYWVLHARLVGRIDDPSLRGALDGVWDAYLLDLRNLLYLLAGGGAIVAGAAASVLRPVSVDGQLRRAWELAWRTPSKRWARGARAVALIALGALILTDPVGALRLVAIAAAAFLVYEGTQELLRLVVLPDEEVEGPGAAVVAGRLVSRRALAAGAFAAVAIVAAGGVFLATGGATQAEVALRGCNGHPELCERTLPEVALPSTHNSFSAVDYPNWLFAQQETGLAGQLEDGVRGFLIDTYWGRRSPEGRVVTDLSDDGNRSRQAYVREFGAEVVDAALRVRDNIGGYDPSYPRDIYMCHRFCELGARLLRDDLVAMRDFLAEHPNEVLIVINQNEGVGPRPFAEVVEQSGLADFVYRGPTDEWPTLAEMIRDNERVLMLAEKPPFERVPWYHRAYALTQETPYAFHRPAQLIDPELLPASCEPERGPARGAELFLVNHWIDTSPAPRPSNAAQVNAAGPLRRRVRLCERLRDHFPNMVAVDFFQTGDLFGVVDELNGVGDGAGGG